MRRPSKQLYSFTVFERLTHRLSAEGGTAQEAARIAGQRFGQRPSQHIVSVEERCVWADAEGLYDCTREFNQGVGDR